MKIRIRPADKIYADYRKKKCGYKCERCGKQYREGDRGLQLSHFHGRRKESVRFDDDNCSVLGMECHSYFHDNPNEHTEWMKKKLGQKGFKSLTIRANTTRKKDDNLVLIYLNEQLKTLG